MCEAWGEPLEAGASTPGDGVVEDPQDEASWLSPPDQVTALVDAQAAAETSTVEMAESVWAGWCEQVSASPLPGGLADQAAVSPAEEPEAPADETTADPVASAASEPRASAVEGGSSGGLDQAKSGAFESDEGSGVDAPVFELPRFGLVASAAHASDAGLSELACPEEGAASPARGVQRALRWVGVAAVMVAVAAFTTVSPWPAGGSLSEPVVSPSPRPVAASAGAGAHRLEADAAGEVSVAPAPSPLLATLLPAEQVRESPSGEEPAYAPWEAEENPRHFLTSPFVVDLASSQRPGGGLPADGNR